MMLFLICLTILLGCSFTKYDVLLSSSFMTWAGFARASFLSASAWAGPKGSLSAHFYVLFCQQIFPWLQRIFVSQTNPAKWSQTNESAKARQALAWRLVRRRRFVRLAFMAGGHHGQGAVSPTLTGMRRTNARSAYLVGRDSALADLWSGLKGLRLRRKISVFGWASRIKYLPIFRN